MGTPTDIQDVCSWNVSFSIELHEPAFVACEGMGSTDAWATARALLAMSVTELQRQFRESPMKRAKPPTTRASVQAVAAVLCR